MTGVEPGWLGNDFIQVHLDLVDALGGSLEAALLIGRVHYRAGTGWWTATRAELMEQTRLSRSRLDRAVKEAREAGFIETRRTGTLDSTMDWRVVFAGQPGIQESGTPDAGFRGDPLQESCIPSSKTIETLLGDEEPEPVPRAKARRATGYPPDFRPKEAHHALAASLGVDLRVEGPQFQDHHTAKGTTFKDWDAALRTWIRNAAKFRGGGNVIPLTGGDGTWGDSDAPLPPPNVSGTWA